MLLWKCNISVGYVLLSHRNYTLPVLEGVVGARMWVFCFLYTSFELSDYAYDVVCDRSPFEVLDTAKWPWRHTYCGLYIVERGSC